MCLLAICMERLTVGNLKALGENSEITEGVSKSSWSHPEIRVIYCQEHNIINTCQ